MGKQDEVQKAQRAVAPSPSAESAPGGMPAGSSAQSGVYAQAAEAAKSIQAGMQQANASPRSLETNSPSQTPQWKETSATTLAHQAQQAGQTMQSAGVTTNATQSAETQAQVQSALASSNKSEHNGLQQGSRCAAAQQQAASAPAPSPSQSMEK